MPTSELLEEGYPVYGANGIIGYCREYNHDEQIIIVHKLKNIENIVELRKRELKKLDDLVRCRFVELFGDPSTNSRGWMETTVGDECFYIKDGPHKSLSDIGKENGGHPFISVRNIAMNNHKD